MLWGHMTFKNFARVGLFSAFLCLGVAWGAVSYAQDANNARAALPELTPEQITQDVKITFDQRSGTQEYAAPTFDPFEDRADLAGSASLRTVTQAVSIDGQALQDGAILDLAFFYNQIGDTPHANRGFETITFLNGDRAPNVLRDSRVLECSSDVQRTVFDQGFHGNSGFFYPYGHYAGHSGFGHRSIGRHRGFNRGFRHRGFGHNSFGHGNFRHGNFGHGGFSGWRRGSHRFGGSRGFDNRGRNRRGRDGRTRDRRDERFNNDQARSRDENRAERLNGISREEAKRKNGRITGQPIKSDRFGNNRQDDSSRRRGRNERRNNARNAPQNRPDIRPDIRDEPNPELRQQNRPTSQQSNARVKAPARISSQPVKAPQPKGQTAKKRTKKSQIKKNQPKRSQPKKSPPKKARIQPKRSKAPKFKSQIRKGSKQFNFFPNDFRHHGGRNVITSVSTDCTREDLLSVHIPAERLEAARFDGLTVLAIDRQGQELPVFIPANYIEGLRRATSGQFDGQLMRFRGRPPLSMPNDPQGADGFGVSRPVSQSVPSNITPNGIIASCPSGTIYQPDNGTCLLLRGDNQGG